MPKPRSTWGQFCERVKKLLSGLPQEDATDDVKVLETVADIAFRIMDASTDLEMKMSKRIEALKTQKNPRPPKASPPKNPPLKKTPPRHPQPTNKSPQNPQPPKDSLTSSYIKFHLPSTTQGAGKQLLRESSWRMSYHALADSKALFNAIAKCGVANEKRFDIEESFRLYHVGDLPVLNFSELSKLDMASPVQNSIQISSHTDDLGSQVVTKVQHPPEPFVAIADYPVAVYDDRSLDDILNDFVADHSTRRVLYPIFGAYSREQRKELGLGENDGLTCGHLKLHEEHGGINLPYVYSNGDGGGATAMHVEDWHMNSMDLCYAGFKLWLFVERDDQGLLEKKFQEANYTQGVDVTRGDFVRQCSRFVAPLQLRQWDVRFKTILQSPGDLVFIGQGVYHQVFNVSATLAEAINLTLDTKWQPPHAYVPNITGLQRNAFVIGPHYSLPSPELCPSSASRQYRSPSVRSPSQESDMSETANRQNHTPSVRSNTSTSNSSQESYASETANRQRRTPSVRSYISSLSSSQESDMAKTANKPFPTQCLMSQESMEATLTIQVDGPGLSHTSKPDRHLKCADTPLPFNANRVGTTALLKRKADASSAESPHKKHRAGDARLTGRDDDEEYDNDGHGDEDHEVEIDILERIDLTTEQSDRLKLAIGKCGITPAKAKCLIRHAYHIASPLCLRRLRDALNNRLSYQSPHTPGALIRNLAVAKGQELRGTIPYRSFAIAFAKVVDEQVKILENLKNERQQLQKSRWNLGKDSEKANHIKNSAEFMGLSARISAFCVPGLDNLSSKKRARSIVLAKMVWDMSPWCQALAIRKSSMYDEVSEMYNTGDVFRDMNEGVFPWISCILPFQSSKYRKLKDDLPALKTILEILKPDLSGESISAALERIDHVLRQESTDQIVLQYMDDKKIEECLQSPEGIRGVLLYKVSLPVLDGTMPVLDGNSPVLEGNLPVLNGTIPALDGSTPVLDTTRPVSPHSPPLEYQSYNYLPHEADFLNRDDANIPQDASNANPNNDNSLSFPSHASWSMTYEHNLWQNTFDDVFHSPSFTSSDARNESALGLTNWINPDPYNVLSGWDYKETTEDQRDPWETDHVEYTDAQRQAMKDWLVIP